MHRYNYSRLQIFLFILLSTFILPCLSQEVSDSILIDTTVTQSAVKSIIRKIIIDGNKRTKAKTIYQYMKIDTGEVYDSSRIKAAEENLVNSGLFLHVKIHPIIMGRNTMLLVAVREKRYFTISSIGGVIYNKRYGEKTERIWIQGYGGLAFNNFRGRNEQLYVSASLIRTRYIGLSWYKPLITVPYYVKVGSRIGSRPSVVTPWHIALYNSSYLTVGRKIGTHSKIFSQLAGRYYKYEYKGPKGTLYHNGVKIESLEEPELLELGYEYNNNWVYYQVDITLDSSTMEYDTSYHTYEWKSNDTTKINRYEKPFSDLYLSLGWVTDKRNKKFDSHNGFYYSISATTNALYPYKDFNLKESEYIYLQLSNEFRFYHRGIWESNTIGYRFRPLIRLFGKGNLHSGIYMGKENTLRGFDSGAFGGSEYNHRFLFSWEYRFHMLQLPELKFPWLAWYDDGLNNLRSRIDGAFIVDCGYIWKDLEYPFQGDHYAASGFGFGLRFMFPQLKRSVCADMVFPIYFPEGFFIDKDGKKGGNYGPAIYLYLDLPF